MPKKNTSSSTLSQMLQTFSLFGLHVPRKLKRGMTMIEILIVIVIIALLILATFINAPKFIARASDARRKSDLAAYKAAFERFYEDTGCYPAENLLTQCDQDVLSPYLPRILCDQPGNVPYAYSRPNCDTYRMYTLLLDPTDEVINQIGCGSGCGPDTNNDGVSDYNYGISSGNTNAGDPTGIGVHGECNIQGQANRCYPGLCSSCCPGLEYRCNSLGTLCIPDRACADEAAQ
jgi:prepilin-type N-terminal cleavage/methylation domain-containing protein